MIQKYAAYLREVQRISDHVIPYYLKWVKEAYTHCNAPLKSPLSEEAKDSYLAFCSNHCEDWQLKQADESIRLYGYFLSVSSDTPLLDRPALEDWSLFGKEMVRVLRLSLFSNVANISRISPHRSFSQSVNPFQQLA